MIIAREVVERMWEPKAVGYHKETVLLDTQELNSMTLYKTVQTQARASSGMEGS